MKIIQEGLKDTKNQMRIVCSRCGAIFDIEAEDVQKDEGIRRYWTHCPNSNCEGHIPLQESSIPRSMLWKIDLRETN